MNLHNNPKAFEELISFTSQEMNLPPDAIRRDYYLVLLLNNLAESEFVDSVVFKGGTSISKCYPGIINRFSEDIDLTYMPCVGDSIKTIEKTIKRLEIAIIKNAFCEKIDEERNETNKSMFVWFEKDHPDESKVKMEIGSSVRPEPYDKRKLKSYIHEYLERKGYSDDITKYELNEVSLNVLRIERTFIDKILAVKRHTKCGSLSPKVRHIYDVVQMDKNVVITEFLQDEVRLKEIIRMTKVSDIIYTEK
jgi:predicted nucleotidyltransferase component of viral defense system